MEKSGRAVQGAGYCGEVIAIRKAIGLYDQTCSILSANGFALGWTVTDHKFVMSTIGCK